MKKTIFIIIGIITLLIILYVAHVKFIPIKTSFRFENNGNCGFVYSESCDTLKRKFVSIDEYIEFLKSEKMYLIK